MSTGLIGFFFGVAVGGFGGIFLLGLFFLVKERVSQGNEIREIGESFPSVAEVRPFRLVNLCIGSGERFGRHHKI
jgi:hypothetical protein